MTTGEWINVAFILLGIPLLIWVVKDVKKTHENNKRNGR